MLYLVLHADKQGKDNLQIEGEKNQSYFNGQYVAIKRPSQLLPQGNQKEKNKTIIVKVKVNQNIEYYTSYDNGGKMTRDNIKVKFLEFNYQFGKGMLAELQEQSKEQTKMTLRF